MKMARWSWKAACNATLAGCASMRGWSTRRVRLAFRSDGAATPDGGRDAAFDQAAAALAARVAALGIAPLVAARPAPGAPHAGTGSI